MGEVRISRKDAPYPSKSYPLDFSGSAPDLVVSTQLFPQRRGLPSTRGWLGFSQPSRQWILETRTVPWANPDTHGVGAVFRGFPP
jgi:hypothetical protein